MLMTLTLTLTLYFTSRPEIERMKRLGITPTIVIATRDPTVTLRSKYREHQRDLSAAVLEQVSLTLILTQTLTREPILTLTQIHMLISWPSQGIWHIYFKRAPTFATVPGLRMVV